MLELFEIFAVPLIIANVLAFIHFGFTDALKSINDKGRNEMNIELIYIIIGIIGSVLAMIIFKKKPKDIGYKIIIPVVFAIETGTLAYLFLFEAGLVK